MRLDLGWVIVVFLGFFINLGPGAGAVFLIGLVHESLGASMHGVLPFSYLAVFLFLRLTRQHLFFQGGTPQAIWVMIVTMLQKVLEGLLIGIQGYEFPYGSSSDWLFLLGGCLVQGVASLLVFPILKKGLAATERY